MSIVLRAADNAAKRAAAAATVVNADVMTVTAWYASRACKLIISHSFTRVQFNFHTKTAGRLHVTDRYM